MTREERSGVAAAAGEVGRLIEVMARLRGEGGCPWDREQTWATLRRYILEEAYELVEAVDRGDEAAVLEECGDLLLEVVFMASIAEEDGRFGMAEVARGIREKLVRRHPHVFDGEGAARDSGEALESWEAVKAREKEERGPASAPGGPPSALPALLLAGKVFARLGTPPADDSVLGRLARDPEAGERALGRLLLQAAGWAHRRGLDPEAALRGAVREFGDGVRKVSTPSEPSPPTSTVTAPTSSVR